MGRRRRCAAISACRKRHGYPGASGTTSRPTPTPRSSMPALSPKSSDGRAPTRCLQPPHELPALPRARVHHQRQAPRGRPRLVYRLHCRHRGLSPLPGAVEQSVFRCARKHLRLRFVRAESPCLPRPVRGVHRRCPLSLAPPARVAVVPCVSHPVTQHARCSRHFTGFRVLPLGPVTTHMSLIPLLLRGFATLA